MIFVLSFNYQPPTPFARKVVIKKSERSKGIGKLLMKLTEDHMKKFVLSFESGYFVHWFYNKSIFNN